MREVPINGRVFEARALKLKEIRKHGLGDYGYSLNRYNPNDDNGELDLDKQETGMEIAIKAIFGDDGVERIDEAGGVAALREVWFAIIAETYGSYGEEKNSPALGENSSAEPDIAKTAEVKS